MSEADIAQLEGLAAGDGEMRVSKRLMRSLVAQAKSGQSVGPAARSAHCIAGRAR
ncbi:hypothetical protein [Sphingobium lactosutens]|uniref:hypothetical protein n=1 Tax=Sphingobium lactosutens TaxID=522773 RepID=UPI0015BE8163|nr:hypothetical protein [Sphingobium lactosutens]